MQYEYDGEWTLWRGWSLLSWTRGPCWVYRDIATIYGIYQWIDVPERDILRGNPLSYAWDSWEFA